MSGARPSGDGSDLPPAPQRWDSDALLSGGLLAGLLTGYAALVYIAALIAGTWLMDQPQDAARPPLWLNLSALAAVAATILPVARWLREGVHDIVYAQHDDPYALIGKVNAALQHMVKEQTTLPAVVRMVAADLRLPYVVIETAARGRAARPATNASIDVAIDATRATSPATTPATTPATVAVGRPLAGAPLHRIPITYLDRPMGTLLAGARAAGRSLSPRDQSLLGDIARQLAIALYAAQLTQDVRASRERIVAAREEERRRIRNDLHDGLAPTLSSLQLQLGAIQRLMRDQPDKAERIADDLRTSLQGATSEIRRLVHDLRPPMLDAFGLVGAVRQLYDEEGDIAFDVRAPDPMPALPAAVEVAAYRIAGEAIHNVIRHSGAKRCWVRIDVGGDGSDGSDRSDGTDGIDGVGDLRIEVRDDGTGFPADRPIGVGTVSMMERAAELGGTLVLENVAGAGARVVARLPIVPLRPGTEREPWSP
ncbi:MAG: GAF domain-containing sensor histidine kinase [Ardenticatenales bacterium]|nr:GAF domain-containing sensor histidine kinase [Ardenticatenales bacterium]